jgi:AcrR family transcriptional regulator
VQYHFPTRTELLQAAIDHTYRRRLDDYGRDLEMVPPDVEVTDHIIDTHWRNLTAPEFRAYQELVVAARSDPELKQALSAHYPDFMREWLQISFRRFGWRYSTPEVMRVGNIAHYLMDGMAYGQLAGQLRDEEVDDLLDYAKRLMRQGVEQSRHGVEQSRQGGGA